MALAALLALALILRLVVGHAIGVVETDGVRYITIARQFQATGNPFDPLFHPLYPAILGLLQWVIRDWETAGRLVATAFGVALLVPAFALARDVIGRPVALLTAALLAVHPGLVRNSSSVLADSTYAFLLAAGVWLGWRALAAAHRALLPVAGVVLGLAYLVRPEAALYLVSLLIVALILAVRDRTWLGWAPWIVGGLVGFSLMAAPYLVYLRRSLGHWTLSGKVAHNLVQDLGGSVGIAPLAHPMALATNTVVNLLAFLKYSLPDLLPGLLILFLLPGVLRRAREDGWLGREGVLLALLIPPFGTLAFHTETRVFFPVLAFVLPFVAAGLIATAGWVVGRPSPRWSAALAIGVLLLGLVAALRPVLRPDPTEAVYRQAARMIAETEAGDTIVMDRKPFVAYYSGRRHVPLGAEITPADLQAAARRVGARLVVLDSRSLEDRPQLAPFVWSAPPPGFDVVRDFEAGPANRLRVLRMGERG
jgi:4-amino-4-deoxy-L-arabinose transferase-like glycosyltransferase